MRRMDARISAIEGRLATTALIPTAAASTSTTAATRRSVDDATLGGGGSTIIHQQEPGSAVAPAGLNEGEETHRGAEPEHRDDDMQRLPAPDNLNVTSTARVSAAISVTNHSVSGSTSASTENRTSCVFIRNGRKPCRNFKYAKT
eukprot:scaffold406426_cov45-Prasinocladus_malaysianus.AAC.1